MVDEIGPVTGSVSGLAAQSAKKERSAADDDRFKQMMQSSVQQISEVDPEEQNKRKRQGEEEEEEVGNEKSAPEGSSSKTLLASPLIAPLAASSSSASLVPSSAPTTSSDALVAPNPSFIQTSVVQQPPELTIPSEPLNAPSGISFPLPLEEDLPAISQPQPMPLPLFFPEEDVEMTNMMPLQEETFPLPSQQPLPEDISSLASANSSATAGSTSPTAPSLPQGQEDTKKRTKRATKGDKTANSKTGPQDSSVKKTRGEGRAAKGGKQRTETTAESVEHLIHTLGTSSSPVVSQESFAALTTPSSSATTSPATSSDDKKSRSVQQRSSSKDGQEMPSSAPSSSLPQGLSSVASSTPSPRPQDPYVKLPPAVLQLFEHTVGLISVVNATGMQQTVVTLNNPQFATSVFFGMQLIISEYGTAPHVFNVQMLGTPQATSLLQGNTDNLMAALQYGSYNFKVNRIDVGLLESRSKKGERKKGKVETAEPEQNQNESPPLSSNEELPQ